MSHAAAETSAETVEEIVFGAECHWCKRDEPCDCHTLTEIREWRARMWVTDGEQHVYDAKCKCSCGRCTFDRSA